MYPLHRRIAPARCRIHEVVNVPVVALHDVALALGRVDPFSIPLFLPAAGVDPRAMSIPVLAVATRI